MSNDHLKSAKEGIAVVVASLVEVLQEEEPTFRFRYLSQLAYNYNRMCDTMVGDQQDAMDVVNWTRDLLSGLSRGLTPEARFVAEHSVKPSPDNDEGALSL